MILFGCGLSPRVRGNRLHETIVRYTERSIPARAGEPLTCYVHRHSTKVYPRACGGTIRRKPSHLTVSGLSPRVRGNRAECDRHDVLPRSIPARAGEPPIIPVERYPARVYPRACGGTGHNEAFDSVSHGLSPRVRGNLGVVDPAGDFVGSIPARAGEPPSWPLFGDHLGVYPRACGGTRP